PGDGAGHRLRPVPRRPAAHRGCHRRRQRRPRAGRPPPRARRTVRACVAVVFVGRGQPRLLHGSPRTRGGPPMSPETRPASFAEEAVRLGGKGAEEVRRMGAVDAADEQVEALFAAKYRTEASPVHRAVWDAEAPADLWNIATKPVSAKTETVMRES